MVREEQKPEQPGGRHNQKDPQSTHEECRDSALRAVDRDAVWHTTFQGGTFAQGKTEKG